MVLVTVAFTSLALSPAQAAPALRVDYANTKSPVLGEPIAAMVSWSKGRKVVVNWGDGNTTVLPAKCSASVVSGALCSRTLLHTYTSVGRMNVVVSARGAIKTKAVNVRPAPEQRPVPAFEYPKHIDLPSPEPDRAIKPVVTDEPEGLFIPTLPSDWPDQMLARVNANRAEVGSAPVAFCPALNRAAQSYAQLLADTSHYAHVGPDGSTVASRARAQGYEGAVGENLLRTGSSVESAMSAFEGSPPHLGNMRSVAHTHIGLGYVKSSDVYGHYWVMMLGSGGNC